MKHGWRAVSISLFLSVVLAASISAIDPGITLVGTGLIPGTDLDKSGLAGQLICQADDNSICIDQATMGGLGSAVTYTGFDNVFLAVPDRGPFDGRTTVPYLDRFHLLRLTINPAAVFPNITSRLLDTRFLRDELHRPLVGDSSAFSTSNPHALATRRFDPEGVAIGILGNFYVSDEYGPYVREFDRSGRLLRRIPLPDKFRLDPVSGHPSGGVDSLGNSLELYPAFNVLGRQANRGMEGLAITPNGRTLVGIMQNALIQDHGLNQLATPPGRVGRNNRLVTIDLITGRTREYVYVMDDIIQGRGVNEILALNDHEFLVLERDNRTFFPPPGVAPSTPGLKRIYRIDLAKPGLTDVSNIGELPQAPVDPVVDGITPVTKNLFIDLLDPAYKVNATQTIKDVIAEKIEGLAWGPRFKDGRHVLYVFSDNDLSPALNTQIYAFAVNETAAGVDVRQQFVLLPFLSFWELLLGAR